VKRALLLAGTGLGLIVGSTALAQSPPGEAAKPAAQAALKRWAAATLPHLQEHLAMAEKLSQR
jgi:hypothetical protein